MIPIKIYLYLLLILIIVFILLLLYISFMYNFTNTISKNGAIWYIVIIILNLINIYYVLNFYDKNKFRKGTKGPSGNTGPRGIKGSNQLCSSCGDSNKEKDPRYGDNINDNRKKINTPYVVPGKCIFPFIDNYKYNYDCTKTKPPYSDTNDAYQNGWCATKVDSKFNPISYAYCKSGSDLKDRLDANDEYRKKRREYIQNNTGIIDIDVVYGNTKKEAREKCTEKIGNWEFYDKDLNANTGGKFIYLCIKRGIKSIGITDIKIVRKLNRNNNSGVESNSPTATTATTGTGATTATTGPVEIDMFTKIDVDLNLDSNNGNYIHSLYLYKKKGNKNFIKDIVVRNDGKCHDDTENKTYDVIYDDLNEGSNNSGNDNTVKIKLCVSRVGTNILNIDTAFVYKDNYLYIFRGNKFYKMTNTPIQNSIKSQNSYPKLIDSKWGKQITNKNEEVVSDCSILTKQNKCEGASNCVYDTQSEKCEPNSNYDSAFTYNNDSKTYFFKGSMVYKYDDKKMKIATGFPKFISDVFPGVPDNINAVFSWGKDGQTYFFKGPYYYKYNDKEQKVERGYPQQTSRRWKNMPNIIDAIFSLPFKLESGDSGQSTYVISGNESWLIDPISDELIDKKPVDERFKDLEVSGEIFSPLVTNPA